MVKNIGEASLGDAFSVNLCELLLELSDNIICKCALGQKYTHNMVKELARRLMIQLAADTWGSYRNHLKLQALCVGFFWYFLGH